MLGLSKSFVIFILIGLIVGYGSKDWINFWVIIGCYAIVKAFWKFTTQKI